MQTATYLEKMENVRFEVFAAVTIEECRLLPCDAVLVL
jgi:hypothetical protein